ncbi:olfactory receptor 14J1-like [Zonotrichia albicollis]|uniref:olfactory receptor 14J1-like n=1 Tax=Zonotrichia albicollis TaxID=44394 RepID=UPI003D80EAC0
MINGLMQAHVSAVMKDLKLVMREVVREETALEKGEAPEHLQYIDDIIVWGNTQMEVFEKGERIIRILLEASFAVKKSKVKGCAKEIQSQNVQNQEMSNSSSISHFLLLALADMRQAVQVFLLIFFMGAEFSLLTVMCYDRYLSICKPLHYGTIFRAVLTIPSEKGRHKAFSTCLPHLTVVTLFLSTAAFAYLKPPSMSSPSLDLTLSVLYSVVPPALNPLIYSLRNQELKAAVWTLMSGPFRKH